MPPPGGADYLGTVPSPSQRARSSDLTRPPRVIARVLAGGLGARLGRDKSRVRLGRRTLTGWALAAARAAGLPARALRRDAVARCGPLGGILTALQGTRADAVLILACDMPFVPPALLRRLLRALRPGAAAVMMVSDAGVGFPLLLRREQCLPVVARQIERGALSLQALGEALGARRLQPADRDAAALWNVNTPEELRAAREKIRPARLAKPRRAG